MKKLFIAPALAIALASCATPATIQNPLTQSRLDTINASWGATLAIAANYRDACAQRLIPPSCRTIVLKLQTTAIAVQAVVHRVNTASVSKTINAVQLVEMASDAINDFKLLQMQYGVK